MFSIIFFSSRTHKKGNDHISKLKCTKGNGESCIINEVNKRKCTKCRYKACIAIGMDKERGTYQFGRHTKKTKELGIIYPRYIIKQNPFLVS